MPRMQRTVAQRLQQRGGEDFLQKEHVARQQLGPVDKDLRRD